jgi:hypothetical protein
MIARFGNVLYWFGSIVAVGTMGLGCFAWATMNHHAPADDWRLFMLVTCFAVAVWLVGRACRYVLAGT